MDQVGFYLSSQLHLETEGLLFIKTISTANITNMITYFNVDYKYPTISLVKSDGK